VGELFGLPAYSWLTWPTNPLHVVNGCVFSGSMYVARLGATNDPADATHWRSLAYLWRWR
jgi:hypothetical protein